MNKEEMKLKIIEVVADYGNEAYINALYEVIINEDYDYIPDLFETKEEFEEFIEKWKPNKCSESEGDR